MNQINNKETKDIEKNKLENNIHGLVLFILFETFVIFFMKVYISLLIRFFYFVLAKN